MAAPGSALAGVPRQPEFAYPEGIDPQLPVPGAGYDPGDEPIESPVPGAGYQLQRTGRLPGTATRAVAATADSSGSPPASRPAVPTAGAAATVAEGSSPGFAGRKPPLCRPSALVPDSGPGADPGCLDSSHRADALSLSQQAAILELRRLGGGDPGQCGVSGGGRAGLPIPQTRVDPWLEPH